MLCVGFICVALARVCCSNLSHIIHNKSEFSKSEELSSGWCVLLQVLPQPYVYIGEAREFGKKSKDTLESHGPSTGDLVFVLYVGFTCDDLARVCFSIQS